MHPNTRDEYIRDGHCCSCHIDPPCGYCLAPWACPECGGPGHADAAYEHDKPHDDALVCEDCREASDADPVPEAATAPTLEDLAALAGPLEVGPLAGGADIRAKAKRARKAAKRLGVTRD